MRNFKGNIGALTVTNADVNSGPVGLGQDYGYAIQSIWTGALLVGTVKLQANIDGATWSDIGGTTQTVNGPGSYLWNVTAAFYDQVRVYFTYTSGSGTITNWAETKGP